MTRSERGRYSRTLQGYLEQRVEAGEVRNREDVAAALDPPRNDPSR